jgi:hypothetical protein
VVNKRKALDQYYVTQHHALGDIVWMKAAALQTLNLKDEHVNRLVMHHHVHAVALGSRYYNLAAVSHGHKPLRHFPDVSLNSRHIDNALAKARDSTNGDIPGAIHTLVMSGARNAVIRAAILDPAAEGWDRVPEPGACDFCTGQAGPGGDSFPAHYNCNCIASPRFRGA